MGVYRLYVGRTYNNNNNNNGKICDPCYCHRRVYECVSKSNGLFCCGKVGASIRVLRDTTNILMKINFV